jgi:hypothetical protein
MSPESMSDPEHPDAGSDRLPADVWEAVTDPAHSILLLVAADASGPIVGEAVRIARARARAGHRTILADGGVTDPSVHRTVGVENLEGLADAFLFGASLQRVETIPPGAEFSFVPAGAYAPDPARVLDSPRWDRIAREVAEAGSLILLFIPAPTPGLGALSRRVRRAILIGRAGDHPRLAARLDPECEILAAVEPPPPPEPVEEWGGESAATPAVASPAPPPRGAELSEPPVIQPAARSRRPVRIALLLALALALGAAAWFLYAEYWAPAEGPATVTDPPAPARQAARGEPVETPIPVSVAVEAHQDLTNARQRVAALRRAEPDITFFLAPVAVSGGVYYRLLAGPVADRETGTALLQRLVDAGHKTAFDSWAVRPTELAFHLGDYENRESALERVRELDESDIPAYIVVIPHRPGPPRYRVYGGAFETAAEAEVMGRLLEEAGVEAALVPRTGDPIA